MLKKILYLIGAIFILIQPQSAHAQAGGLGSLSDITNSKTLGDTSQHSISFILPYNAQSIVSSDYIQVLLPGFSNVTTATSIIGTYSGTPQFSISGNYVKITGIGVTPGNRLSINGITATNPNTDNGFLIVVFISQDQAGTLLKNIGNTVATLGGNQVAVTASIDNPQSTLLISGYTAPNTYITFTREGTVLGTDIATSVLGYFAKEFSGLTPGTQSITLYGVDSSNLTTAPIPLSIYTPAYQQTTISNLLLSPTLQIATNQVVQGDDLIATGSAKPNATINIFTDTPLRTYVATAAASGLWDYTINNTSDYIIGDYRIYTIAQDESANQSLTSISLNFSILSSSGSSGTACGDLSEGDLNCDGSINLTDFSILMYYWGTTNASADVNTDESVNLTDFSIMMYYWGT